jgi:hypothetical protein
VLLRLWPPIALAAMVALRLVVGKGSTPLDDWFHRYGSGPAGYLMFFTDPWLLAALVAGTLFVAIYQRQWRFAAVTAVSPLVAIALPSAVSCWARDRVHRSPHIGTRAPPNLTRVNPDCDLRHSEG